VLSIDGDSDIRLPTPLNVDDFTDLLVTFLTRNSELRRSSDEENYD